MSEIAFTASVERELLRRAYGIIRLWLASTWLALAAIATAAAPSPTNSVSHPQPARWLLVVDTSAVMAQRAQALEGVLGELLLSGINGQMQAGDELGIWSYNKELFAGIAPMQIWDPARSNVIAGRSSRFIGRQKFEGQPHIETVIPELNRVMKESRRLTVLIFSDGAQNISGTPFDAAINAAYAKHRADLARTRMPLVTVLRSERGNYLGQTVSFAPWPIEFPPFTPEPETTPPLTPKQPMKSIVIGAGTKETIPATNTLVISNAPTATPHTPVAEVQPVAMIPVQPTPKVEPVVPTPLPETNPAAPAKPVELSSVALPVPQPAPVAPAPAVEAVPVVPAPATVAPAPLPADEANQPRTAGRKKWLLILGAGCMWVAIVIALVLVRRSRRPNAASLITRSFDRNQH